MTGCLPSNGSTSPPCAAMSHRPQPPNLGKTMMLFSQREGRESLTNAPSRFVVTLVMARQVPQPWTDSQLAHAVSQRVRPRAARNTHSDSTLKPVHQSRTPHSAPAQFPFETYLTARLKGITMFQSSDQLKRPHQSDAGSLVRYVQPLVFVPWLNKDRKVTTQMW